MWRMILNVTYNPDRPSGFSSSVCCVPPSGPAPHGRTRNSLVLGECCAGPRNDVTFTQLMLLSASGRRRGWHSRKNTPGVMLAHICSQVDAHISLSPPYTAKVCPCVHARVSGERWHFLYHVAQLVWSFLFHLLSKETWHYRVFLCSLLAPFWGVCSHAWLLTGEAEQQGKYSKCVLSTLRLNINKVYISISH